MRCAAVPSELYGFTERDLFIDLLDAISDQSGHFSADLINDRLATMACKAAVKGESDPCPFRKQTPLLTSFLPRTILITVPTDGLRSLL